MNEDYLWDKTGEPDPELAELERKLGRLGFKPSAHPLQLPAHAPMLARHRKNFYPVLAIAAALVLLLLAGGLWSGLLRSSSVDDGNRTVAETAPGANPSAPDFSGPRPPIGPVETTTSVNTPSEDRQPNNSTSRAASRRRFINRAERARRRELIAVRASMNKARVRREQQLAREGEAAKAQLIKALHITSDALNAVQKKIQGEQEEERRPIS
jgi:hypothetical protein